MEKLVSIIIPVYNAENFIYKTVQSILDQTYANIEILLINDGSTDSTLEVVSKFNDSRLNVITKANSGVSDTRNYGINFANGEYITFCDADDYMSPELVEVLVEKLETTSADIACCGCMLETPTNKIAIHGTNKLYNWDNEETIRQLISGEIFEPSVWGKLFKKEIFSYVFFRKGLKYSEDFLFDLECFINAKKITFYDAPLYHYVLHENSSTTNANPIKRCSDEVFVCEETVRVLSNISDELQNLSYNKLLYSYLGEYNSLLYYSGNDIKNVKNNIRNKIKENKKDYKKINMPLKNKFFYYGIVYVPRIYKYMFLFLKKITPDRRVFKL